jgi:hypothetical protein
MFHLCYNPLISTPIQSVFIILACCDDKRGKEWINACPIWYHVECSGVDLLILYVILLSILTFLLLQGVFHDKSYI